MKRYIDQKDEGKISTYIDTINNALNQAEPYIKHADYDTLEKSLKEASSKLIAIAGVCTTKIDIITEKLIAYEFVLR